VQTFSTSKQVSTLEFPVWQRTDNLGPTTNAGPMLDGVLNVTASFSEKSTEMFSWIPSNISWAPTKISMDLHGKKLSSIELSTNATNGCYGTLAQPLVDRGVRYGVSTNKKFKLSEKA
jgi:hypothetical protein